MLLSPERKGVMEVPAMAGALRRTRSLRMVENEVEGRTSSCKDVTATTKAGRNRTVRDSLALAKESHNKLIKKLSTKSCEDTTQESLDTVAPLASTRSKPMLVRSNTAMLRGSQRSSRAVLPMHVSEDERHPRKQSHAMHRPDSIRESVNMTAKEKSRTAQSSAFQTIGLLITFLFLFMLFITLVGMAGYNMNLYLGPVSQRTIPEGFIRDTLGFDIVDIDYLLQGVFYADAEQTRATVNDLTKITCAVFAIMVQVTAILVQIATREFSTDAIYLFVKDKTLVLSCTLYTFTLAYMIWLTSIINEFYIPRGETFIGSILVLLNVLFIVPYFIYLTRMLNPFRLVHRVAENGLSACLSWENANLSTIDKPKGVTIWAIENIAQLASNAMQLKKKTLVYTCLEVLSRFTILYGEKKHNWDDSWFKVAIRERETPDFFSLSDDNIEDLESRMTWVEWKVLRQYQNMFQESLNKMKDACYVLAVNTRMIAEAASIRHDFTTWDLCVKFFNTYIRYGISNCDIRTVYNILHQYRAVANTVLHQDLELLNVVKGKKRRFIAEGMEFPSVTSLLQITGNYVVEEARDIVVAGESRVITLAHYLIYYSSVGLEHGMGFIAETAAHELASICETAFVEGRECHDELLNAFLSLHQVAQDFMDDTAYWGIRRAHVKLGAVYLRHGARQNSLKVQESMYSEDKSKLLSIWESLAKINDRDFWEVNDRGTNMNYLSPLEKAQLREFFTFFGVIPNDLIRSTLGSSGMLFKSDSTRSSEYASTLAEKTEAKRDSLAASGFGAGNGGDDVDGPFLQESLVNSAEQARRKRVATVATPRPPDPVKRHQDPVSCVTMEHRDSSSSIILETPVVKPSKNTSMKRVAGGRSNRSIVLSAPEIEPVAVDNSLPVEPEYKVG